MIDADKLGQLRTGAASGVAARHLARSGAATLGVIGCGWQAESQVACIRAAVPAIERVVAYCRTESTLREFCERNDAEPGETAQDPAAVRRRRHGDRLVDPVLRGDWLRPGALVCAVGANDGRRRELDNVVLERATFVCCDSVEDAQLESADLIEPIANGVLDWLEVHELQEVVAGELAGGASRTTTSSSSSRTASPRGTSPRRRRRRACARARRRPRALDDYGVASDCRARSTSCSPSACTTRGGRAGGPAAAA